MNGNDTTEPKDSERDFEVAHRVYAPEPKYDVRRRISMGSETVARCWDLRWARKIARLLEKESQKHDHHYQT